MCMYDVHVYFTLINVLSFFFFSVLYAERNKDIEGLEGNNTLSISVKTTHFVVIFVHEI